MFRILRRYSEVVVLLKYLGFSSAMRETEEYLLYAKVILERHTGLFW